MRQLFEDPANTKAAIELLRTGGDKAYLQLYKLYQKKFIKWGKEHSSIGEEHLVDVFQDALIVLFKKLTGFNYSSTIVGFLWQTFKYKLYHKYREQLRFKFEEEIDDKLFPDGYDQIYRKTNHDHLKYLFSMGLQQIGDPCKRLLKLKFYDDFDAESIAKIMEYKNADVVYAKTFTCIKRLRKLVADKL